MGYHRVQLMLLIVCVLHIMIMHLSVVDCMRVCWDCVAQTATLGCGRAGLVSVSVVGCAFTWFAS